MCLPSQKNLIPEWLPGCRRITPGDGYLESLVKSNVNCVFQGIQKITPDGLIDDAGEFHPVDILVCATGVCHVDPAIEAHKY